MIHLSALAKHKIDLLSIHITIVWGEEDFFSYLDQIEESLLKIELNPDSFPLIGNNHLRICKVCEDSYLVYQQKNNQIVVVTIYDYRQNPVFVYNDLIEHFHEN